MDETKHAGVEPPFDRLRDTERESKRGPGYETRDASIPTLVKFAIGLFVLLVVALWAMRGLFNYFRVEQTLGPPASPFADTRPLPPSPRLQAAPARDWRELHASEDEILNTYSWADRQAGVVRIPVSRAMDLLAQRGLPVRANAPPKEAEK
jgi:hypothetical protein